MLIIYSTSESGNTVCWHQLTTSDREGSEGSRDDLEDGGYGFHMELVRQFTYRKEATMGVQEATTLKSISRTSEER